MMDEQLIHLNSMQELIFLNFLKATGAWSSSLEVELANFPGLKYFILVIIN